MFQSTYLYKVRRQVFLIRLVMSSFNPRTYIRYDIIFQVIIQGINRFNPRTYIRYDLSVVLYKLAVVSFNPRTYIRYDTTLHYKQLINLRFNPRTYIRYDIIWILSVVIIRFQSTYLYKVRHTTFSGSFS